MTYTFCMSTPVIPSNEDERLFATVIGRIVIAARKDAAEFHAGSTDVLKVTVDVPSGMSPAFLDGVQRLVDLLNASKIETDLEIDIQPIAED